ncbi:MAG: DNA polymerase III subunit beta, partial [Ruminococcus sp.]|nr:DNA polymerase III subunit beta [Ruminococcus sp.]
YLSGPPRDLQVWRRRQRQMCIISTIIKDDSENDCIISVSERHIIFELNNFFVISRLLEGAFHNYRRSIPESYRTEVFVNKKDFIGSLERCSLIIDDRNKSPIKCEVTSGTMKISCRTAVGRVNDTISADITGDSVTIGFNHRLMLDALKAAEGDKVRMRFSGSIKVIEILPPEGENYIFLVMPIQLKG